MFDNFTNNELYKLYTILSFYNFDDKYDVIFKELTTELNHRLNLDQLTIDNSF